MKLLKIIALFLLCRLIWIWFDICGADLGLGESLPFCIECSGLASMMRLLLMGVAIGLVVIILKSEPEYVPLYNDESELAQGYRIHWHRIALLVAILSYPFWVWWIDVNTIIPGPNNLWLTKSSCTYPGVKGTYLWGIVLTFIVTTLYTLHKD